MMQTMLFADGDTKTCELYRRFAMQCGYEAEIASSGLDCMRKLRRMTPTLLVLDFNLHWGGGDGVLGWLREEPQLLPSRIVLTCTDAIPTYLYSSLALASKGDGKGPAVKTLIKPFPLSALLDDPEMPAATKPEIPSQKMTKGASLKN